MNGIIVDGVVYKLSKSSDVYGCNRCVFSGRNRCEAPKWFICNNVVPIFSQKLTDKLNSK